ncbi:MAG: 4'-phosphopantetheinyl transferase superfamily protein [Candidatus Cloacimonetes bacterium]|jgi:4'-phosphopantetheinyl transferase|nr:4'-phosphopantetheinyl transferase superfamily protein [Candidatus Cloacimonadota bacterium]
MTAATLAPGTIGIVPARVSAPPVPWDVLERAVTQAERDRAARFLNSIDARRHILGRGIVRLLLSPLLDLAPDAICFTVSGLGKPLLDDGPSFSISHSGDYVLVALAAEGRLGVDIEVVRALRDLPGVARVSFGPDEYEHIMQLPEGERLLPFFRTWTRKEAMLKALGCGLSGLSRISVSADEHVTSALLRLEGERIEDWTLRPLHVASDAEAAVAWDRPLAEVRELEVRG